MKSSALLSILLICIIFTIFIFLIPPIYNRVRLELTGTEKNASYAIQQTAVPQADENTSVTVVSKLKEYINLFEAFSTVTLTQNGVTRKAIGVLSHIKYSINGTVNTANVLSGKEDWLFYQSKTDGDSLSDFVGTNHLTEDELAYCLQLTQAINNHLSKKGITFILMIAPNKEQVYFDKMPDQIQKKDLSKVDVLADYFGDNADINLVYPLEALINAKSKYQVYNKYDTHWNSLGAYIGEQELLKIVGYPRVDLSTRTITTTKEFANDLAKMVDLTDVFVNDNDFIVDGIRLIGENNDIVEESVNINENATYDESVLFIGDSFRRAMLGYLYADFYKVAQAHRGFYKSDLFESADPDIVVWELVERGVNVEAFEAMANNLIKK